MFNCAFLHIYVFYVYVFARNAYICTTRMQEPWVIERGIKSPPTLQPFSCKSHYYCVGDRRRHVCHGPHVGVRGQFCGVGSLHVLLCGLGMEFGFCDWCHLTSPQ